MRHVWDSYVTLSNRRTYTVIGKKSFPEPIPLTEISAYCRDFEPGFALWEKRLLADIDDAVLEVTRFGPPEQRPGDKVVGQDIPASKPQDVLAMFRRLSGSGKRKS